MLRNNNNNNNNNHHSEKMALISSVCTNNNEWTQQNNPRVVDVRNNMASVAAAAAAPPPPIPSVGGVMDPKVAAFSQQQQSNNGGGQEALRCPRCDSTNTKFCYYNNYSLSQPRHFCKACKRYWTRGGTLRSVPVGGGCRKNKRVKRHPNNSSSSTNNNNNTTSNNSSNNNLHDGSVNSLPSSVVGGGVHRISDLISSPSNPLFYNSDHNLMNFPFSRYALPNQPQMNGFGLGFTSGLIHNSLNGDGIDFRNHNNKLIFQDLISSSTTNNSLSNYSNTNNIDNNTNIINARTAPNSTTTPPTISSFLASTFQMKGNTNSSGGGAGGGGGGDDGNNFETILPLYEDSIHMKGDDIKMEFEGQNRSLAHHHQNPWAGPSPNQMDHQRHQLIGSSSSDPALIWGHGPNLGAWLDPSNSNNLGSSVTSSLI